MYFHYNALGDDIELRNAIKQLKLHTLPKVFIIHLKRFSIDHIVTKNSTHVKYPMILDVGPYCTEVSKHHCIYTLASYVCSYVTLCCDDTFSLLLYYVMCSLILLFTAITHQQEEINTLLAICCYSTYWHFELWSLHCLH